jgi:hypothetical protein
VAQEQAHHQENQRPWAERDPAKPADHYGKGQWDEQGEPRTQGDPDKV